MDLPPEIRAKIECIVDENHQLRNNLKLKDAEIDHKNQLLFDYEEEVAKLQDADKKINKLNASNSALQSESSHLRNLVNDQTSELTTLRLEVEAKSRELGDAQRIIKDLNHQPATDVSLPTPEPSFSEELAKLEENLNEALYKLASSELRERQLNEKLQQLNEEYECIVADRNDLRVTLKDLKAQNSDLLCELNELKSINNTEKRGNSMFSEVADGYKKLEEDMKKVVKDLSLLKRENYHLKDEVEEARLLASRREGLQKMGSCVCEELKPEIERERLRSDRLQRTVHALESQIQRTGSNFKVQDIGHLSKTFFDSLKMQLDHANKENIELRLERNILKDAASSKTCMLSLAENREKIAQEQVELLKKQLEVLRSSHAKELARLENPELFQKEFTKEPAVSETLKSASDSLAKLRQNTLNVKLETPAKQFPLGKPPISKTPAAMVDPLRHLTLNQSATYSMSENRNESMTRERRIKKESAKKAILRPLANNFVPIQLKIQDGAVIKIDSEGDNLRQLAET